MNKREYRWSNIKIIRGVFDTKPSIAYGSKGWLSFACRGLILSDKRTMKRIALITISILCAVMLQAQDIKQFIDSILTVGRYAISHSPEYREAYRPHYRIVERSIFEREILPQIEQKTMIVRIDNNRNQLYSGWFLQGLIIFFH